MFCLTCPAVLLILNRCEFLRENILKTGFDISCKLSPLETVCMNVKSYFLGKRTKNNNFLSAELAKRVNKIYKNTDTDNVVLSKLYIGTDKGVFFIRKMLISFLFLDKNICCGYSLEAPCRGASNEYPQHMFLSRNKKNIMWIPSLICSYEIYALTASHWS